MIFKLKKHQNLLFYILLALVTIAGGFYIYKCTKYAPWGFSDSATYIASARNLANGSGLGTFQADGSFSSLQIFAPLFSIVLSVFAIFKVDLVLASAILDVFLFMSLIAAGGWFFWKLSRSAISALCFAALIVFSPALINDYTSIMSEPLAITLGTVGFLVLLVSMTMNSTRGLVGSALLIGLALLSRYAFAAYAAAGLICLLLLSSATWRKRIVNALLFSLISVLPLAIWFLIQFLGTRSIGSRHYSMEFSIIEKLKQFFTMAYDVVKYWLPYRTDLIPGLRAELFSPIILLLFMIVLIAGIILSIKNRKSYQQIHAIWLLISGLFILAAAYLLMLLVTFSVSTELISIDERMLSPLLPVFYGLLLACGLLVSLKIHPRINLPVLSLLITLLFFVFNYHFMRTHPSEIGIYPNGYTSSVWKENPILNGEHSLPEDQTLISNAPDIIMFYLNRPAYYLSANPIASGTDVSIHDKQRLESMLQNECAVIILFDPNTAQRYERLADSLDDKDADELLNSFFQIYSNETTHILRDENCRD